MADPRADVPVLEQSRVRVAAALIAGAALVVALIVGVTGGDDGAATGGATIEAGLAYPVPPREGRILVEVLNGTDRVGLARIATRALRREGVDVITSGNASRPAERTRIVVRRGDVARGRIVARALGTGEVEQEPDTLRRVDVSVYLGTDYRPVEPLHP